MINDNKSQLIALEVIRVLKARFDNFPEDSQNNRNAPFHEAFLNAFKDKIEKYVDNIPYFISLSSWLHGLNTTLGQSFFENVAHILSNWEKRTFKKCKITEKQQNTILEIITDLKNGQRKPNLNEENKLIFQIGGDLVNALDFTADVFIMEKDYIEAIELKSVRPNAGEMRGEKLKILSAKACLKLKYPDKEIRYFIGFPFDPLSDTPTGFDKEKFMKHLIEFEKYFAPEEVLLAGELWDRLSGETNTMEKILEIINKIATPNFLENYEFINNPQNFEKDKQKYMNILKEWCLLDEIKIFENYEDLKSKNPKIINQELFKDGKYNINRKKLIKGNL
ncbi:TdeIII family type II restriction endonuclease [Venenivibrio stagnispumantis]|uniref:type II site-specific deoxyribonuclease n=1 Tax=Venenivibrio stagnispumantis TaxID=407998 RepID=A0AA45WP59_9AQUI|nr:TdeIII family type II restriction endonuclease [Venenivibrio stagnispumantis]MCW4573385.1 TdeIII family type II restriction endonuclease [Venenivibrio stagnispumantis]SMP20724.1 Type II restriction endonuclease, TdeIII [Venenivibrio stagnispumantis]